MKVRRLAAIAAMAGATAGCGGSTARQGAPLPEPTPVVPVTMSEYRFKLAPSVPSGRVVFRMRNAGRLAHRVTLVPVPEDMAPIDVQLRGAERRFLEPFAGMPERRPGMTSSFAVDLEPGRRYAFVCFTVDRDNRSHAQKGMAAEFRTAGRPTATESPSTTAPPAGGSPEGGPVS